MKRFSAIFTVAVLAFSFSVSAQTGIREIIRQDPSKSGAIYTPYHYDTAGDAPAPKGYKPFYISHFGRHGSRWHTSEQIYETTLGYFAEAERCGALTELGRDAYERLKVLSADAEGMEGQLTPRGRREHREIAERMYRNYPEVFVKNGHIEARSTLVPRCIMSMAAFCERLKELNPSLDINRGTGKRYLSFLANYDGLNASRKMSYADADRFAEGQNIDTVRFMSSLFDREYADSTLDARKVMRNMYRMSCITADVDYLNISLYDLFTEGELFDLWRCFNVQNYLNMGPSAAYGDTVMADAVPLLCQIIEDADDAIANGGRAAFLRFGHDVNVVPLLGYLEVEGLHPRLRFEELDSLHNYWQSSLVTPMATNVQMVFFRSKRAGSPVLVKVLHNESPCRLPLPDDLWPYYRWDDFRNYYLTKIQK